MSAMQRCFIHLHHQAHPIETRTIALGLCERNPTATLLDCGSGDGEITMQVAQGIGAKGIWGIEIKEASALRAGKQR